MLGGLEKAAKGWLTFSLQVWYIHAYKNKQSKEITTYNMQYMGNYYKQDGWWIIFHKFDPVWMGRMKGQSGYTKS